MDERLTRIKTLIGEIEEKETELNGLIGGAPTRTRAAQKCSKCGSSEHNARNCEAQTSMSINTNESVSPTKSTSGRRSMSEGFSGSTNQAE